MGGGHRTGRRDADAALFREREQRFRGLLHDQGQVDGFPGEGPFLVSNC